MSKKRRRYHRLAITAEVLFILVALLGIVLAGKRAVKRSRIQRTITEFPVEDADKPEITEAYLTPNINSRSGKKLEQIKGIVIHYTANPGSSAMANRNYFESRKDKKDRLKNKVSSHFIIGIEGEIVQCIPLNEIAYASNARNIDTVSIECCHPQKNGKFTRKTYESLVKLCRWLCATYHIASKDEIIRHYDVTGKLCPKYFVKHEDAWEQLKEDIWNG